MKNNTTKTDKLKIYCINIMDDYGELWLDNNKKPLSFVHCNDANFREEYQSFIFEYLNVEFISKHIYIKNKDLQEKLWDASGDENEIYKLLKKQIDKL